MEHASTRPVPKAVPAGSARGESVSEFPTGREGFEVVRLHAGQQPGVAADVPTPDVASVGFGSRFELKSTSGRFEERRSVRASPVFRRTAHGFPGVAEARIGESTPAGTAPDRFAGPAEPGASFTCVGAARAVPRPRSLGRESGVVRGNISVRTEAAAEFREGAAAVVGFHLGENISSRYGNTNTNR